jgi:hypothetical protein
MKKALPSTLRSRVTALVLRSRTDTEDGEGGPTYSASFGKWCLVIEVIRRCKKESPGGLILFCPIAVSRSGKKGSSLCGLCVSVVRI